MQSRRDTVLASWMHQHTTEGRLLEAARVIVVVVVMEESHAIAEHGIPCWGAVRRYRDCLVSSQWL